MSRRRPELYPGALRPYLFAHRGFSARAPQNTLSAFALARDAGAPGVELDVHRCASGELVVVHDHNLKAVTGVECVVEDESWERLRRLDAGSSFDARFAGERLPLLSEVFELLGAALYYDIEIKSRGDRPGPLEAALIALIRKHDLASRVMISSFDPRTIKAVKGLAPDIPTAVIYSADRDVPWYLRHGEGRTASACDVLKPSHAKLHGAYSFLNTGLLRYPIITWTVDDPKEAKRCLAAGAAGVITNDPAALLAAGLFG
jgi:glycerophosphoryl diester phosphodiesterase